MTNKLTSKLVSVFLTVAICITTVFGCLVSVSAENSPSYVITGAQCVQGDTLASAIVEFNVPAGVAAGVFTIDNTDNWYSSVEVSLYGELAVSTDSVSISDDNGNVEFTIIDENGTAKAYTSIAFKLDFVFAAPIEDDIEITISDVDLNGIYATENYTTFVNASTSAFFTAGCQHKFVATGEVVYTSTDPEYTVYRSAKCSQCGEEKSDYQVVPTVQNDEGIVELWDGKDENGKWIGYQYSTFSGGTGAKDNPYIIKYSEQLAYLTTSSATTYESTAGKYYKVDDSIKAFNMNTTGLDLSGNMTAQEVYDALNDETVNRVYWAMAVFAGNFDGNGVEIYGLHTGHMKYVESGVDKTTDQTAGLFPKVAEGAVIKNITLKNSYMYTASTSGYAGGIIGGIFANAANYGSTADTVYIENCTVYDCYVGSKNITNAPGVLVGFAGTVAFLNISNTLVYDNEVANAKNAIKSIVGNASKWAYVDEAQTTKGTNNRVIDSVILGSTPYDANGSWWFNACDHKVYQNVYFDNTIDTSGFGNYGNANSKLTQLASVDNAKGSAAITNMLDLDWNTNENPDGIWFAGNAGQYPTLLKAPKAAVADSSDFGWKLLGVNLTYKNNGSFAINFHYLPKYDADVALYVTNANENTNTKVLTNPTDSSFAGTSLPAGAKMFTLDNLSARDISVLWLATIVTTSADETSVVYSETKQISIGNYAEDVVLGNAFYDQNASDADKAADKTVAAALINYGMASDGALAINKVESSSTATIVEKWDAYENGKYVGWYNANISGEGTKESPFIIDTAEKLAQLCRYGCNAGVYYKVADEIKAFDMNTVAGVDLTVDNISATDVKNAVADKILGKVWFCDAPFKGNFDGNGVTIYGLCTGPAYYNQASFESGAKAGHNRGGLFAKIDAQTAVIKNITIKNSYSKGDPAGMVFGETLGNGGSAIIENIIVANCYIDSSGGYISGVVGGYCLYDATTNTADKVKLNNCLVYDNVLFNKDGTPARLIGTMEAYCDNGSGSKMQDTNGFKISNTIAIGCKIEKSDSYWQKNAKYFSNCYTTEDFAAENTTITKLSSADAAKGNNALTTLKNLNAADWFFNTTTYPEPSVFHDIKAQDNGDGTHVASCGCGLSSLAVAHVYENGVCSCGVAAKCGEIASVYTGAIDTSLEGAGTSDNPYLVTTADEFAAVALGKIASTADTYFKVEGVDAFYMNGGKTVADMTNANDVKSYFVTNAATVNNWKSTGPFMGNFDGNGVTVYGVYANHTGQYDYAGLFPKVDGHSSIKNIAIKNSYFSSYSKDGAIGSLVGGTIWKGDSNTNTSVTIENVVSANNYLASTNSGVQQGASVLMGRFFEKHYATINNCIMYGNLVENAYTGVDVKSGMITEYNGTYENTVFNNIIAIGVAPWTIVDKGDGTYGASGWYLSVLDTGHFKNIYTDQSTDKLQAFQPAKNSAEILEKYNINSIAATDMVGEDAVKNITSLDGNWIYSAQSYPELRVFHDDELKVEYAADNYAGHIESCSCGLVSPVVAHDYNENSKCIECEFTCDHANADVNIAGGDCLIAATKTVKCSCGYEDSSLNGNAAGHTFTNVAEVPSQDCQTPGTAAHKYCAVCDKKYAADADVLAAYNTALTDEELKLPVANHTPTTDDSGIIYEANDANHSKICSVCQEKFDTESHVGSFVADGANGHKGQCSVCMLDTSTEAAPHNFVGSTCEDCNWTCNNHNFVEGNVKNEGDCTNDRVVATLCSICKIAGTDKITTALGHVNGEIKNENIVAPDCDDDGSHDEVVYCTECEKELSRVNVTDVAPGHIAGSSWEENHISDCINGDSYELVTQCSVCFAEASREVVNIEATGHDILHYEELAPNCVDEGWIAHSQCNNCGEHFAFGTSDKFSEEYINSEDIYIDADPDAHKWVEVEAVDADCENGGTIGYKYCKYCALFVAGETQLEIEIDFDALWDELDPIMTEEYEKTWETFTAAYPEPGEDATDEEWNEFNDAFLEVWNPVSESIYDAAYQDAIIEAAKAESVEFETEAKGHTITYVEAVAATYDSEGTKAHYACECGKLYSDAEGKNEITAESLVIEKLVKEDDTTSDKPAGDTSDTSPETGDTVVSLLAFASLLGAAFIATKKFRNK